MRFSTVVVFIATMMQMHYHPVFTHHYYEERCLNPNGQEGDCRDIKLCEPLIRLFRQYGSKVNSFIQKSICGFDGWDSRVCCTDEDPDIPDITRYSFQNNNNKNNNNSNNNNNNNNYNNNNGNNKRYGPLMAPQCGIPHPDGFKISVVGGMNADVGEWPWLTILGYRDRRNPSKPNWLCGGSLISSRHVLTAAHCVHGRNDLYVVRLGEHNLSTEGEGATIDVGIQKFSIHPQYNPQVFTNDLAVLKLQQDVEFNRFVKPICLPVAENLRQRDFVNTFPFIAGWGSLFYTGTRSDILQKVQVPIVSKAVCQQSYQKFKNVTIDDRVTCGGFPQGGKGACQGDSGGPIMLKHDNAYYAIAVISYGYKCASPGIPGVFTRINTYLDFILPLLN